ncbi:MAG: reverse transcriptase/maturase family protein [Lachnospiraceae bacterium]|nr:reverse transcriptase/maturase family protein [Lachnospiraceae bacterium]
MNSILKEASDCRQWQDFLAYKLERRHLSAWEEQELRSFIERRAYIPLCAQAEAGEFPGQLPHKKTINKEGSRKKRVVYSFPGDEGIFLKFIAWKLHRFDRYFSGNCYAFRQNYGVYQAIRRLRLDSRVPKCYCLKADISNYFNSIRVDLLLDKLTFVAEDDPLLYRIFARILLEDRVVEQGHVVTDLHGAMAGIPISPFFANVYLAELDKSYAAQRLLYFRYSDDILLFADTLEELMQRQEELSHRICALGLSFNPDKVQIYPPGEKLEFLGFSCQNGRIDLSEHTVSKTKHKIKRKAEALRRWQRRKELTPDKAAIGLIHAMNRKFYGNACPADITTEEDALDEFTWSRWFFPNLTVDTGLKTIDCYLQEYIRYCVTGRHYKGNYRISYDTLKQWGYCSLVHEYYGARRHINGTKE